MLAVEASAAPGVLDTDMPATISKNVAPPSPDLNAGEFTAIGASLCVNLIVAGAVMRDELQTFRKAIDQFAIEATSELSNVMSVVDVSGFR